MKMSSPAGLLSLLVGATSVAVCIVTHHVMTVRLTGNGKVLRWLDGLGLVHAPAPHRDVVIKPMDLTAWNDETAINFSIHFALYLAGVAMLLAVWADHRREDTLFSGGGFICGAAAFYLHSQVAGFGLAVVGITLVLVLRRWRTQ
jgi:hypothetical protein